MEGSGSVNDLCWSPRLIVVHLHPSQLHDELASLYARYGPGVSAWTADVPSAFRLNHVSSSLLFLFVYRVISEEYGVEYFQDLTSPFGWAPSEWGWQVALALVV